MGISGKGLYASPVAERVKSDIGNWLAVSTSLEATVERLRERFEVDEEPSDTDSAAFWLAIADQLHGYGLKDRSAFKKAREALKDTSGALPDGLRDNPRGIKRLQEKWKAPAPKPKQLPSLKPERFVMKSGDVFAYPTMGGNARSKGLNGAFRPDAENAFVCFRTARVFFDREARYFIAPLSIFSTAPLTIEACVRSQFICQCNIETRMFSPVGGWAHFSTADLKLIEARKIGSVDPNPEMLVPHFGQSVMAPLSRETGPDRPLHTNLGTESTLLRGAVWGSSDETLESFVKAWSAE